MSGVRPEALAACGAFPSPAERGCPERAGAGAGAGAVGAAGLASPGPSPPAPLPAGEGSEASAASSMRITAPSETSSPTFTLSSFTVPAALDGTSIVALSDSSVIRLCSFVTVSPAFTSTSITGTLSWPPMSGTFTSIVFAMGNPSSFFSLDGRRREFRPSPQPSPRRGEGVRASEQHPADVAELLGQERGEARGQRAVDHAVVVGQR